MKSAHCLVKKKSEYPWQGIHSGIRSQGYDLSGGTLPADLLVTWTPWNNSIAHRAGENQKKYGKDWVVFENGYLPLSNNVRYYCAGLNGFNGHGDHKIHNIDESRLGKLNIDIKDWTTKGEYILIVSQFGHRDTRYSMPIDWPDTIIKKLREYTDRPIIFKSKAGKRRVPSKSYLNVTVVDNSESLSSLIKSAWAVVVWNSKAAVKSLIEGVPIVVDAPVAISKFMCTSIESIETPYRPEDADRLYFFNWLANAQWSEQEIATGKPFEQLL